MYKKLYTLLNDFEDVCLYIKMELDMSLSSFINRERAMRHLSTWGPVVIHFLREHTVSFESRKEVSSLIYEVTIKCSEMERSRIYIPSHCIYIYL